MRKHKEIRYHLPTAIVLICILLIFTSCAKTPGKAEGNHEYNVVFNDDKEITGELWVGNEELSDTVPMLIHKGRLYIPMDYLTLSEGIDGERLEGELSEAIPLLKDDKTYYLLNDITKEYNFWAVISDLGVRLCEYTEVGINQRNVGVASDNYACLRLEDIMADPSGEGRFTHEKLEKIRVMGQWLDNRGQEYSVSWIPLYKNPGENIKNDLTKEYNLLNADFLYTLDYLMNHSGHMGIHGLTHQDGNSVSGEGIEFGKNTSFSDKESKRRIKYAKTMAEELGFHAEFFVFPHHAMTASQAKIAEDIFSVIYQQKPDARQEGRLEWFEKAGNRVLYVPTPADYVKSSYDGQGILDRINGLKPGTLVSLFFHPSIDYDRISCVTDDMGIRILSYDQNGILPIILETVQNKGLDFKIPWEREKKDDYGGI